MSKPLRSRILWNKISSLVSFFSKKTCLISNFPTVKQFNTQLAPALDLSEIMKIPGYSRVNINSEGKIIVKYRAVDPEDIHTNYIRSLKINDASESANKLCAIKDHAASLFNVIRDLDLDNQFKSIKCTDYNWESVRNQIHMAASINDVYADTSSVDDSGSISYCRPAWEFEKAHSETVSKYIASQIFFNFVWLAYECAIEVAGDTKEIRKKTGAKGRVILAESKFPDYSLPFLRDIYILCLRSCYQDGSTRNSKDIQKLLRELDKPIVEQAAEIIRIVRNRVMHGEETAPYPEDHGGDGESDVVNSTQRLYYASRITLILIQALAFTCLVDPSSTINREIYDEMDDEILSPNNIGTIILNIHATIASKSKNQLILI